jgi:hypothetical protein
MYVSRIAPLRFGTLRCSDHAENSRRSVAVAYAFTGQLGLTSSGMGDEDLEVAGAGVSAIPGARTDW